MTQFFILKKLECSFLFADSFQHFCDHCLCLGSICMIIVAGLPYLLLSFQSVAWNFDANLVTILTSVLTSMHACMTS